MTKKAFLSWIKEWEEQEDNPILYYKMQGEVDPEESSLGKDDFMIIIQTKSQKHMMIKFANGGICCDTTHGTTGYDFKLTSFLIVDDFQEGIPVAHCLSNKENYAFMKMFCTKVLVNSGRSTPKWFMSDTASQFYEAFAFVNQCNPMQLICTWHVDKAWRDELRSKVPNLEIQGEVYKYLRTVLEQTDQIVFEDYLVELMHRLNSSTVTAPFGEYFAKNG